MNIFTEFLRRRPLKQALFVLLILPCARETSAQDPIPAHTEISRLRNCAHRLAEITEIPINARHELVAILRSLHIKYIVLQTAGWLDRTPVPSSTKADVFLAVARMLNEIAVIRGTLWTADYTRFDGSESSNIPKNTIMFRGDRGHANLRNILVILPDGSVRLGTEAALDQKGFPILAMMKFIDHERLRRLSPANVDR